jgi:threonylcarbamoyladenosine tRNA methylthiotransferase CDKAL1
VDEITQRIAHVVKEGVVEIWLTSEDVGAYGHDIGVRVTDLLWKCIETLEENDPNKLVMIRVGMTNPPYILEQIHEMARILSHPRVYSFLHM